MHYSPILSALLCSGTDDTTVSTPCPGCGSPCWQATTAPDHGAAAVALRVSLPHRPSAPPTRRTKCCRSNHTSSWFLQQIELLTKQSLRRDLGLSRLGLVWRLSVVKTRWNNMAGYNTTNQKAMTSFTMLVNRAILNEQNACFFQKKSTSPHYIF